MQLICYKPKEQAHAVPIFIIPPCINKYYILDLSPNNSLISFLLENNFQVFLISWVNPDSAMVEKNFEDYLKEGLLESCEYILKLGYQKINFVGYCIGGTFLAILLSYLKSKKLDYVNSATFLTTLLDYDNPGELSVFINKSTIAHIETDMQQKGYFDGRYLSNSFSLLRANDLVWSFFVNNYLLGKSPMPFDLLYWNADSTNLPAKMFSYYLRNMYINNLLKVPNALTLLDTTIDLGNIDCNSFFVAAKDDHIALWRSIYQGMKLLNGNKVFCLTDSGHIAGIVNPPSSSKYSYRINDDLSLNSEEWFTTAKEHNGSWWIHWLQWLQDNNKDKLIQAIDYKNLKAIEEAPGSYVRAIVY
jgi:polyhydroxyalkanoate synthase